MYERETKRNPTAKVHLNAANTWTLLMMTTLTVCEQIFVFSIPSSDRIVFACAQHSTLHTAAHGSMLDDSVLLLMMPTNVARLVMLVSIHSYTHSQHTPNELFCRIAANDCVISAACVCEKRRDQMTKAGGARDWIEPTAGTTLSGTMLIWCARFSATVCPHRCKEVVVARFSSFFVHSRDLKRSRWTRLH